MNEILSESVYFGFVATLGAYLLGSWLRKKTGIAVLNPLLTASLLIIAVLLAGRIDYEVYNEGAQYVSYLLTPATVCLAIPLYRQLRLLRENLAAVAGGIAAGVAASAASIFVLSMLFGLSHEHYVTLLPKSITTAIGMGVSEEAGGIVTLTVMSIAFTGILGSIICDFLLKLCRVTHPVAKGLAIGTSSHAMGTAKALELGEIEGAMSSLSIAVAGLMTVVVAPIAANLM